MNLISSDDATIEKRLWRLRNRFAILEILSRDDVWASKRMFDLDDYMTWPVEKYLDCYETDTRS